MPEPQTAILIMCDIETALYFKTIMKRIPSPPTESLASLCGYRWDSILEAVPSTALVDTII